MGAIYFVAIKLPYLISFEYPANTRWPPKVSSMLVNRLTSQTADQHLINEGEPTLNQRRWANIESAFGERMVFVGYAQ